jgi:uncharacterized protein (DUF2342 family)
MLSGLFSMMGPMLFSMQSGAMVGQLASRSLGQYDLPLPRPASDELVIVSANVEAFGEEWSLPGDDLRLWLCLSELATHAVLGVPHVRSTLEGLVLDHVGSFSVDPSALQERIGGVDPTDLAGLQQALGDPSALLGAILSPAQLALRPRLGAIVDVVVGYVDWVVDTGRHHAHRLLRHAHRGAPPAPGRGQRGRALRRAPPRLELGRAQYERGPGVRRRRRGAGRARCPGPAVERGLPAADAGRGRRARAWLARIDLPDEP